MVALGILMQLYSLPKEPIVKLLTERFKKRGQALLDQNLQGLEAGIRYVQEHPLPQLQQRITPTDNSSKLIMTGNEASAISQPEARDPKGGEAAAARVLDLTRLREVVSARAP